MSEKQLNVMKIHIKYKICKTDRDIWRTAHNLLINLLKSSEIEWVTKKYMWKHIKLFDTALNSLTSQECFKTVIADEINTILLISETKININKQLKASVSVLSSTDQLTQFEIKRNHH